MRGVWIPPRDSPQHILQSCYVHAGISGARHFHCIAEGGNSKGVMRDVNAVLTFCTEHQLIHFQTGMAMETAGKKGPYWPPERNMPLLLKNS